MNVRDTIRLESWLTRYDFWLDSRGVPLGVRSALGKEMRANLTEAAADVGLAEALAGVGEPRRLADEAAEVAVDPTRPTWLSGVMAALTALAAYAVVIALAAVSFFQGVIASGVDHEVEGRLLVAPGLRVLAQESSEAISLGLEGFAWLAPALAALAFVLGSRLWRLAIPADQRRERVRLPRALPETGPRWLWGLLAAVVAYLVMSTEFTASEGGLSIMTDPVAHWPVAVPGAVVAFLLIGQPWRARRH